MRCTRGGVGAKWPEMAVPGGREATGGHEGDVHFVRVPASQACWRPPQVHLGCKQLLEGVRAVRTDVRTPYLACNARGWVPRAPLHGASELAAAPQCSAHSNSSRSLLPQEPSTTVSRAPPLISVRSRGTSHHAGRSTAIPCGGCGLCKRKGELIAARTASRLANAATVAAAAAAARARREVI